MAATAKPAAVVPRRSAESLLHPVAGEDAIGERRDLPVVGCLKQSECLRLAIAGGQPDTLIADASGVAFELRQQPAADAPAARGLIEKQPSDLCGV